MKQKVFDIQTGADLADPIPPIFVLELRGVDFGGHLCLGEDEVKGDLLQNRVSTRLVVMHTYLGAHLADQISQRSVMAHHSGPRRGGS
jgi:hypothetical protein